jgi:bidirectional [NiFe] hydrogenase diaphorase subunit
MDSNTITTIAENECNRQQAFKGRIFCCTSTACQSSGCDAVYNALTQSITSHGLSDAIEVTQTGCMGMCSHGPLVRIEIQGQPPVLYREVEPMIARLIIAEHVAPALRTPEGKPFVVPDFLKSYTLPWEIPFLRKQQKIVLSNAGVVNPERIEDYLSREGYYGLKKVLTEMSPEAVINIITASGLRGRGGAGFPTGVKWRATRNSPGEEKFIICNGDEGDPGAYMDRSILEADPHAVLKA